MRKIYNSSHWKMLVSFALFILIAVIAIELLVPNNHYHNLLNLLDFGAIAVLGTNLVMGYSLSPYKGAFVKSHALELLAIMPLWGMLRLAEYDYLLIRLFRTSSHFGVFEDVSLFVNAFKYRMG